MGTPPQPRAATDQPVPIMAGRKVQRPRNPRGYASRYAHDVYKSRIMRGMPEANGHESEQATYSRRATVRRDITLPRWHDEQLSARMHEQGIGRSEAIRQLVSESRGRAARVAALEVRQRANAIKTHCANLRARPSTLQFVLAQIEQAADEINRYMAEAAG